MAMLMIPSRGMVFFGGGNADLLSEGCNMKNPKQKDHLSLPSQGKGNFWFDISGMVNLSVPYMASLRDIIYEHKIAFF